MKPKLTSGKSLSGLPVNQSTAAEPKFEPTAETLPPAKELEAIARVSPTDVNNAAAAWVDDNPEDEFDNLPLAQVQ